MKLPHLILTGLAMTPFALAEPDPQQNGKTFGEGTGLPRYLAPYDVKGPHGTPDGVIDEEERQAMEQYRDQVRNQFRKSADANGDGVVCDQEREKLQLQLRQMIEEHRLDCFNEAAGDDGLLNWLEFLTLPGIVNMDDLARAEAIFARLDTNDSGDIDETEFMAAVRQCDQDRDGSGDGKQTGRVGGRGS